MTAMREIVPSRDTPALSAAPRLKQVLGASLLTCLIVVVGWGITIVTH
jgi:hypothetical protein